MSIPHTRGHGRWRRVTVSNLIFVCVCETKPPDGAKCVHDDQTYAVKRNIEQYVHVYIYIWCKAFGHAKHQKRKPAARTHSIYLLFWYIRVWHTFGVIQPYSELTFSVFLRHKLCVCAHIHIVHKCIVYVRIKQNVNLDV